MTGARSQFEAENPSPAAGYSPATEADSGSAWRLPSGEDLISFALACGLAAGPLSLTCGAHKEPVAEPRHRETVGRRRL